jgi:hypothetical protein
MRASRRSNDLIATSTADLLSSSLATSPLQTTRDVGYSDLRASSSSVSVRDTATTRTPLLRRMEREASPMPLEAPAGGQVGLRRWDGSNGADLEVGLAGVG